LLFSWVGIRLASLPDLLSNDDIEGGSAIVVLSPLLRGCVV
jgi:hypothetical protein